MSVYLFATLDTKGPEAILVKTLLRSWGVSVTLVDTGCLGPPTVEADIATQRGIRGRRSLAGGITAVGRSRRGGRVRRRGRGRVDPCGSRAWRGRRMPGFGRFRRNDDRDQRRCGSCRWACPS